MEPKPEEPRNLRELLDGPNAYARVTGALMDGGLTFPEADRRHAELVEEETEKLPKSDRDSD
jgi:hypothetical protein